MSAHNNKTPKSLKKMKTELWASELSDFKRDFFCHYEQLWFSSDDFAKMLPLQKDYQKELLYKYVSDFQVINAKLGKK